MDNNVTVLSGEGRPMDPMEKMINRAEAYYTEMKNKLDQKIPRDVISKREGGNGKMLDYLEGWYVIARMNEVFGQGNWHYETHEMRQVFAGEVNGKQVAHYVAKVAVYAMNTVFVDYGYGDGADKYNPGKAHELAVKEAVTDGIKRAAKNFGMSMGLALYDKTRENVDNGETEVKPKTGTGNPGRTAGNGTKRVQNDHVAADTPAPESGAAVASAGSGSPPVEFASKAKTREELNVLITTAARVAVAKKKFSDMAALRGYMGTTFGADSKEALTDQQAVEFLTTLETMINGG